jgi:muramoyltetrapeptide carboxypeptidase
MHLVVKKPKTWPVLEKNSPVYLVSPASGSSEDEIAKSVNFLKSWNVKPITYSHKNKNTEPFLAHDDSSRLAELKDALYGTKSSIIACLRGGYGSARLIKELLKLGKPKTPKLLIGFSDITSLHLLFNNCWNLPTLHAPVIKQCAYGEVDETSINSLKEILSGNKDSLAYSIKPLNKIASSFDDKSKLAPLIGGNLSIIQSSLATAWSPLKKSKYCLLIEEVGEKAYALDRMLRHLQSANIFDKCQALFIADIDEKPDNLGKKHLDHVLQDFIKTLNIAVFSISGIGHKKTNLSIALNSPIFLSKD